MIGGNDVGMAELQLSQFPLRNYIRMAIKNSSGYMKRLHLGTAVIESPHLTILADPMKDIGRFKFSKSKSGGLLFTEDVKGDIMLHITSNITVFTVSTVPEGAYLEILKKGNTVEYIPLIKKEDKLL